MRWIEKEPKKLPEIGTRRVTEGFLLFPLKIGRETRWFEHALWIEEYQTTVYNSITYFGWIPIQWYPYI